MQVVRVASLSVRLCRSRYFSLSSASMSSGTHFHTFDVSSQVFLEKQHTLGIVNLKPIVPLHVLLIPRQPYKRLADVPRIELNELFESVQTVSSKMQDLVGGTACTVSIQDGPDAVGFFASDYFRKWFIK